MEFDAVEIRRPTWHGWRVIESKDRQWGVRLADVRLPRLWPLPVLLGLLLGWRQRQRALREIEQIGKDLGEITVQRWREGDERTDRLLTLTKTLARLTWVLLFVAAVTLIVNVVTLVSS